MAQKTWMGFSDLQVRVLSTLYNEGSNTLDYLADRIDKLPEHLSPTVQSLRKRGLLMVSRDRGATIYGLTKEGQDTYGNLCNKYVS